MAPVAPAKESNRALVPAAPAPKPSARSLTPAQPSKGSQRLAPAEAPAQKPSSRGMTPAAPVGQKPSNRNLTPAAPVVPAASIPVDPPTPPLATLPVSDQRRGSRIIRKDSRANIPAVAPKPAPAASAKPSKLAQEEATEPLEPVTEELLDDPPEQDATHQVVAPESRVGPAKSSNRALTPAAPKAKKVEEPEPVEEEVEEEEEALGEVEEEADIPETKAKASPLSQRAERKEYSKKSEASKARPSSRIDRVVSKRDAKSSSIRLKGKEKDAPQKEEEDESDATLPVVDEGTSKSKLSSTSRRSQRNSVRGEAPAKKSSLKKWHIAVLIAVPILLIALVIAWGPISRSMLLSDLDNGGSLDARKNAAASITERFPDRGTAVFGARLLTGAPETQKACVYGLGLVIASKEKDPRTYALKAFQDALAAPEATPEIRKEIIDAISGLAADSKDAEVQGLFGVLLLERLDAENDPELKAALVRALGRCPAPGVCVRLIKLAKSDQGALRDAALAGIEATATPDAAALLLQCMTDANDEKLARVTLAGFNKVSVKAPTGQLVPLLDGQPENVVVEIVKALAIRKNEREAVKGVVKAASAGTPKVKLLAVEALVSLPVANEDLPALSGLPNDANEDVRMAFAKILGQMHDDNSYKLLCASFEQIKDERTVGVYAAALGTRTRGKNKDRAALALGIHLLEKFPGAAPAIGAAMAQMTLVSGAPANREAERKGWGADKWKAWYANLLKRDEMVAAQLKIFDDAQKLKDPKNRDQFEGLYKKTQKAQDTLSDIAKTMCKDDPEDEAELSKKVDNYQVTVYYFEKNAPLNLKD